MKPLGLYFLMLLLLPCTLLDAQELNERLDSILASRMDTHQVRSLSDLAYDFNRQRMIVPDTLFKRGVALAHELNDYRGLVEIHVIHYICDMNSGEIEEGLLNVAQVIKYARETGDEKSLNQAAVDELVFLTIGGRTEEAANKGAELVAAFHKAGNTTREAQVYSLLETISSNVGNRELAALYGSTAVRLAHQSGNELLLCSVLFTASINNGLMGNADAALGFAEEALEIAYKNELEGEIDNALYARAEANIALGNYAEALRDLELLQVGKKELKLAWRMTSKGIVLQRLGRSKEARELLLEAARIIESTTGDPVEMKRVYQALQTVGLNPMQYDSVVRYGKLMVAMQDSLQTAKNTQTLLELKEKYETEEKEVKIQLQEQQLAAQRVKLYATIFGMLLALAAGTVLFFLGQRLRRKNDENERLLNDKETLIGEIHHRVKNNLQVVSSLLQLQRRGLEVSDEKGREALLESQSRVNAMGLIHNKLYQGKEVTSVHMPEYLEDLGETLLDAYRLEEQVEIFYDVADISLDVDNAIPLGLIINELVTNSLKYAFPKGREGTIEITLHRENGQLRLAVTDNGVGAAAAEKRTDSTSFGGNLIGLLTQKLKGTLRQMEIQGYGVEISFTE